MSWRLREAILVLVVGIGSSASGGDLSGLPPDQQQRASCMLAVVRAVPGVTDAKFRFHPSAQTFLDYAYRPHSRSVSPRRPPDSIDVSRMLSPEKGKPVVVMLGGMTSDADPDLNDNDDGMLTIVDGWQKTCGVDLVVVIS